MRGARAAATLTATAGLAVVPSAGAHLVEAPRSAGPQPQAVTSGEASAAAKDACTGAPIAPDRVITGSFGKEVEGSYVMIPFDVAPGTDAVRVKYCHDQPALTQIPGTDQVNKHTLDIGIYDSRPAPGALWGEDEFRGWGGSSREDVTVSPEGTIDPDPAPVASDKTTVGFIPGPIPAGQWAVELGVAAIGVELPGEDGKVQWRVEIDLLTGSSFTDQPYQPVAYDETPAHPDPGWYAGDLHVHARNSHPEDATMREAFSYAFGPSPGLGPLCRHPDARPGAGLDFIALTDYVTSRHWGEIGKFQADCAGKLIVRGAEVITYRGHANNQATAEFVDYRTGPIYERRPGGGLKFLRGRPANAPWKIFDAVHVAGGWTQINHPETFPAEVPTFGNLCRGCSWEFSKAETRYPKVDAIEIATGPAGLEVVPGQPDETQPAPQPFTPLAIEFWEQAIDANGLNSNHIAAVGASDSHNAGRSRGRTGPLTQSPIGEATTVVRAEELSETGIRDGIQAGHTYVKIWGNDGPDLRFRARDREGSAPTAIIGDEIDADRVQFLVNVLGMNRARAARPGVYTLFVFRNGLPVLTFPFPATGNTANFQFDDLGPGRYRLQIQRLVQGVASIETVSSPIYLK